MTTTLPSSVSKSRLSRPIRVLIVDDSLLIRTTLATMLADEKDIQVVGEASTGQEAVRMTMRLHPDVLTMDIRMPKMDGLEATRYIMRLKPTPIIVVASSVYSTDYNIAFNAIEAGALTVIEKPKGLGMQDYATVREQLVTSIRTMAGVTVVGRREAAAVSDNIGPMTAMLQALFKRMIHVVAIATSTGGPAVMKQILSRLPDDFCIPITVVQHITPGFAQGLAEWLNSSTGLSVRIAKEGDKLAPRQVLISPAETHMLVNPGGIIHLDDSPPVRGQRPSATLMFESVAKAFGASAIGVILTGMGEDGSDGLEHLSNAGAHIIAQDEASSAVFGMPRVAIERGFVDEVLPPEGIAVRLNKLHRHMQSFLPPKPA
jgi:two-component system chemotaxis response regulator CheB